jgi:hypothetical protein
MLIARQQRRNQGAAGARAAVCRLHGAGARLAAERQRSAAGERVLDQHRPRLPGAAHRLAAAQPGVNLGRGPAPLG